MIKITNVAKNKLINLIKNEGKSIYLYIKGGGCNGFSYKFKILNEDKKPNKSDEIIKLDNYNMYLCNKSLLYLIGTEIDYIEDIMGSRFNFDNNKIDTKCGCGTSVNFK
jgi:iron-sulfur cluster insertion protein